MGLRGLGVIVWSPLASGFLTDGFDLNALEGSDFRRTHQFASLDLAAVRDELRSESGSITRGAIHFVLRHPAVTGAIVGVRNQQEGEELARIRTAARVTAPTRAGDARPETGRSGQADATINPLGVLDGVRHID